MMSFVVYNSILSFLTDFTSIVFEQVQYSVGEQDLSIMVCARADGLLERSYDVGFTTSNGTATGTGLW